MNRQDKIRIIEDVKNGIPVHLALNRDKYKILVRDKGDNYFWSLDKKKISIEDQEKYFPDSTLCVNVSEQFKHDENGEIVELAK
ncbi:MAG: hypothetical protein HN778_13320 [Prolixibacteraceae bacterium]|jgi:hypothetical protein|nr:hypothetical protein [Prolixibacteraceae bacterium]MBT6763047.1 hypothetical protein [Prolixibacteraceae bacterium]MBT6997325.1 hypothetical protein [Prolixibacteraceae bacterium]MBT7395807.1 hypothetical protein [Prolixibacteraceae bacterium]